jgi:hypothetical protein
MEVAAPPCALDLADAWRVAPKDEMLHALQKQGVEAELLYQ